MMMFLTIRFRWLLFWFWFLKESVCLSNAMLRRWFLVTALFVNWELVLLPWADLLKYALFLALLTGLVPPVPSTLGILLIMGLFLLAGCLMPLESVKYDKFVSVLLIFFGSAITFGASLPSYTKLFYYGKIKFCCIF